ncbi:Hypothetical predicted protein [Mytilus galloprovincialis]|uniref:Uncharacterized protein n=1 Tax=Mytilus galloprovincialis TaxID=29158 RepID=A0A8B6DKQ7_MYTGA|nr:Hypothetical predicted protein [Mytilus galloprovincialis]
MIMQIGYEQAGSQDKAVKQNDEDDDKGINQKRIQNQMLEESEKSNCQEPDDGLGPSRIKATKIVLEEADNSTGLEPGED